MAVRVQIQKAQKSGTGTQDMPQNHWEFYDSMRFLENFLKPRDIISSSNLRKALVDNRPESEQFAKKRQATKDKFDEEYHETKKLFTLAVEHLTKPTEVRQAGIQQKQKREIDGYLQAVLDCFGTLKKKDQFDGFLLVMKEIKKLKI